VDALARERVEGDRERGRECLALAGLHLGDRTVVEDHAADQLDVEVAHAERAPPGLARKRERLEQEVVERLAACSPLPELVELLADLLVLEQLHLGLEIIDPRNLLLELLELLSLSYAERAVQ
jgi:hypothetical protein